MYDANINLLNTLEAATYLNLKPSTLCAWRVRGGGPQYVKIGRAVRYALEDLKTFIGANRRAHTAEISSSTEGGQQ